jgi:hypothetical protein
VLILYSMFFEFQHLKDSNMNYFEHMFVSLNYAFILFVSCIKAFIHSFIPDLFITSTSECIIEINNKLERHTMKRL